MAKEIAIGFAGNPNCGKTTLFNAYTGANLKVANWPGVTVEKKEGRFRFHDSEYREEQVDVEVQMAVKGSYTDTENVRFRQVPAQRVASVTYQGGYDQIGGVNQAVVDWAAANNCRLDGPMFNIYHVGPAQTSDPAQWVTEVCYPVGEEG